MSSGRVTSADVAREANVSRATVSYVINDVRDQRISEHTRAKVRDAAQRLGYAPNAAARTLRDGRNQLVVIGNPQWALGPLVATALTAAVERLTDHGFTPVLAIGPAATGDHFIEACQRIRPCGLIAPSAELTPDALRRIRASGTAAIVAIGERACPGVSSGIFDQAGVGRLAVKHLAERGHRHILAIGPSEPPAEAAIAGARLHGASRAADRLGIRVQQDRIRTIADLDGVLHHHLYGRRRCTAVFAYNDELALATINHLQAMDLSVSQDVAVVGCDNIPAAQYFAPPLTTVAPEAVQHYQAVADALMRELDQPGAPQRIRGRNRLIIRASTKADAPSTDT